MPIQTALGGTNLKKEKNIPCVFLCFSSRDHLEAGKFKESLMSQYRTWQVLDHPVRSEYDNDWKTQCDSKIRNSATMICLIGNDTHRSSAVDWEILRAKSYGVPVVPVYVQETPPYPRLPKSLESEFDPLLVPTSMKELDAPLNLDNEYKEETWLGVKSTGIRRHHLTWFDGRLPRRNRIVG